MLCTCDATSLSKMASLYGDSATMQEFCLEEKKSGRKLSLNCVWDRIA